VRWFYEESHQVKGPCRLKIGLCILLDIGDSFVLMLFGILLYFVYSILELNVLSLVLLLSSHIPFSLTFSGECLDIYFKMATTQIPYAYIFMRILPPSSACTHAWRQSLVYFLSISHSISYTTACKLSGFHKASNSCEWGRSNLLSNNII
jgi:hypothetical protein